MGGFSYSFDENGHLDANLTFFAANNTLLTTKRLGSISDLVKKKLGIFESQKPEFVGPSVGGNRLDITRVKRRVLARQGTNFRTEAGRPIELPDDIGIKISRTRQPDTSTTPDGDEVTDTVVDPNQAEIESLKAQISEEEVKLSGKGLPADDLTQERIDGLTRRLVALEAKTDPGQTTVVSPGAAEPIVDDHYSFFYLGYVLEAIKESIKEDNDADTEEISFIYRRVNERTINDIFTSTINNLKTEGVADVQTNIRTNGTLENVFNVPVDASVVEDILTDKVGTTPLLRVIREMIDDNTHIIPGMKIETRMVDNAIEIFVATIDLGGLIQRINSASIHSGLFFDIKFGDKNSLCESIDMNGKVDPNAGTVYQLPMSTATGRKVDLSQEFITTIGLSEELAGFISKREKASDTNVTVDASEISRFISSDPSYYQKVLRAVHRESAVFGQLFGYYMKRTSITIHGTVGMNVFNLIRVTGLIPNLQGIYMTVGVQESINADSYNTVLECVLIEPDIRQTSNT
jgi:hypothetical protein